MSQLAAKLRLPVAFSIVSLTCLVSFFVWDVYDVDLTVFVAFCVLTITIGRWLQQSGSYPSLTELDYSGIDTLRQTYQAVTEAFGLVFNSDIIAIDTRMLAWFRVGIGLVIVGDVLSQLRTFTVLYGSEGIFPYNSVSNDPAYTWGEVSFQTTFPIWELASGDLAAMAVLVTLALAGVALSVGYHTRFATIVCFFGLVSIQSRNPWMLSIADKILLLVVFWSIFLPLGKRFSLDAYREQSTTRDIRSIGGTLLLFQVILLYFINGYQKLGVEEGLELEKQLELLPLLLAAEDMAWAHTQTLSQVIPLELQQLLSVLWTVSLIVSPLLLVVKEEYRLPIVLPLMFAHAFFIFTYRIGTFPYTMLLVLLLFVQSGTVDRIQAMVPISSSTVRSFFSRVGIRSVNIQSLVGLLYHWPTGSLATIPSTIVHSEKTHRVYRTVIRILTLPIPARDKIPIRAPSHFAILVLILAALLTGSVAGFDERQQQLESGEYYMIETDTSDRYTPAALFGLRQARYSFFTVRPTNVDWIELRVTTLNQTDARQYDVFNDRYVTSNLTKGEVERPYSLGQMHNQLDTYRERFYRDADKYYINVPRGKYYCQLLNSDHGPYSDITAEEITYLQVEEQYNMSTRNTLDGRSHEVDMIMDGYDCSKPDGGMEKSLAAKRSS